MVGVCVFLMRPPCSFQSVFFPLSVNVTEVYHTPAAGVLLKALRTTKSNQSAFDATEMC